MKRRFPGLSKDEYENYLSDAITVHNDAIEYVKSNSEVFYKSYDDNSDGSGLHFKGANYG